MSYENDMPEPPRTERDLRVGAALSTVWFEHIPLESLGDDDECDPVTERAPTPRGD